MNDKKRLTKQWINETKRTRSSKAKTLEALQIKTLINKTRAGLNASL